MINNAHENQHNYVDALWTLWSIIWLMPNLDGKENYTWTRCSILPVQFIWQYVRNLTIDMKFKNVGILQEILESARVIAQRWPSRWIGYIQYSSFSKLIRF
jgi:hypothetical protein